MVFPALLHRLFITFCRKRASRHGEMQVEGERICRFCKKLLNPPQGKRVPVVSVFNRLKNKELIAPSGQESVVLAAEIEKLGNSLHRGVNFPELSCLSCARQVVRIAHSCTVITSRCNEPSEKLVDSPDQFLQHQLVDANDLQQFAHRLVKPLQRNAIKMETRSTKKLQRANLHGDLSASNCRDQ